MASSAPDRGSLATAVRDAARFDRSAVSARSGALAAIPVVVMLTLGTVAWNPVAGVTMGAGAMLVGIAWRIRGGRPPVALLATDAFMMAFSTFVGCLTGASAWLHLGLLFAWALAGGLLVSLGNRGGLVGNQALIAFVVFGRFSQPAAAAAGLGGLVLAGGGAQVLFLSLVGGPGSLRAQRAATARGYRVLAGLATATDATSTLPAATALDEAQATLSSLALFGDPALMTLRNLVSEGLRLRVELSAIHALMRRPPDGDGTDARRAAAQAVLERTAEVLELTARAIEGERAAAEALPGRVRELSQQADQFVAREEEEITPPLARRLAALAGQLRAVGTLALAAGTSGTLRDRRPRRPGGRLRDRVTADLAQLRANASLQSPAGRHALRLAVVVLVAELASRHLPFQRGYWMVVAAATTLRPEFGATFTRGTERALGTCFGVALAGGIVVAVHPAGGVTIVLVGLLAWVAYSVFSASFAVGFAFVTALVVFLLNAISPDTLATAYARLLDTLVGGALGLLAYAVWPTWSEAPARQALADLLAAERAYLAAILNRLVDGRRADANVMRSLGRRARLSRTTAQATVARSLSEPATRRIDAEQSQGMLAAMRRLVQAAHVLRLGVEEDRERGAQPALAPLAGGIDRVLADVEGALRAPPDEAPAPTPGQGQGQAQALPDLRAEYRTLERTAVRDGDTDGLLVELDEIVDATNSLAAVAGLQSGDDASDAEPLRTSR